MSGDIHISHVDTLIIGADAAHGLVLPGSEIDRVTEELSRGASPEFLADIGEGVHPEAEVEIRTAAEEETELQHRAESIEQRITQEKIRATARATYLVKLVGEVDSIRGAQGHLTNHRRPPKDRASVERKLTFVTAGAQETLEHACGSCALRPNCTIGTDLSRWIDVHPYKDKAAKRPGGLPVVKAESRDRFLRELREDPLAHCDPSRRDPAPKTKS